MGSADSELFDEESDGLAPVDLGRWSLRDRRWESRTRLAEPAGILMPMGQSRVGFYEHPKLIDVSSCEIVHRWTEFNTGRHQHSYRAQPLEGPNATPPLALHWTL